MVDRERVKREIVRIEQVEDGEHHVTGTQRQGHRADRIDEAIVARRQPAMIPVVQRDKHLQAIPAAIRGLSVSYTSKQHPRSQPDL